jgi:hypothetical protein
MGMECDNLISHPLQAPLDFLGCRGNKTEHGESDPSLFLRYERMSARAALFFSQDDAVLPR